MENSSSWIRRSNRLIRMVSELHRMGYQLLRIMPYEYPLAWRMSIAPKDVFSVEHGARLVASTYDWPSYSSAQENRYFDWQDASQDNARGLANKFITRFPEVANAGRGRDWEYAGWLDELLGVMGHSGLPIIMDDEPGDFSNRIKIRNYEHLGSDEDFPLPPPGLAREK